MRALLVLTAWFALAAPALAQTESNFYLISASGPPEAPTNIAMADASRTSVDADGYRRTWTWTYFTQESSPEVRSLVIVAEFDCAQNRYRLVQITGREWSDGDPDTYTPDNQWRAVTPQSNAEVMQSFGCSTTETLEERGFRRVGNIDPDSAAALLLHQDQNN